MTHKLLKVVSMWHALGGTCFDVFARCGRQTATRAILDTKMERLYYNNVNLFWL